jgi:hypothetical protein
MMPDCCCTSCIYFPVLVYLLSPYYNFSFHFWRSVCNRVFLIIHAVLRTYPSTARCSVIQSSVKPACVPKPSVFGSKTGAQLGVTVFQLSILGTAVEGKTVCSLVEIVASILSLLSMYVRNILRLIARLPNRSYFSNNHLDSPGGETSPQRYKEGLWFEVGSALRAREKLLAVAVACCILSIVRQQGRLITVEEDSGNQNKTSQSSQTLNCSTTQNRG